LKPTFRIRTPQPEIRESSDRFANAVVKNHLRPGGIVQVWVFTGGSQWDLAFPAAAVKALQTSFRYVRGFESLEGLGLHLLASDTDRPYSLTASRSEGDSGRQH
jgi:hypothetical protein